MQIQKVQPVMIDQTSFGAKKNPKAEKTERAEQIADFTERLGVLSDDEFSPDALAKFVEKTPDDEFKAMATKLPKPMVGFLATAGIGVSAALGMKFTSGRVMNVLQKWFSGTFEAMGNRISKTGASLTERVGKIADTGFRKDFKKAASSVLDGIKAYGRKGAKDKTTPSVNLAKKIITNTAALISGGFGIKRASRDSNGNGVADLVEKPTDQKELLLEILRKAAKNATAAGVTGGDDGVVNDLIELAA